jgi:Ca2+-binding RTX toxin-like protein
MSAILSPDNTESLSQIQNPDGGFSVVGQQDQENIIEIKGDAPADIIGGSKADKITTGAGDGNVFTGKGNDLITGGSGDDIFRGGEGDDTINGDVGNDVLKGQQGNDVLRGGFGNDILHGGTGDDIFEFFRSEYEQGSIDKILDFNRDGFSDKIKISGVADNSTITYDQNTGFIMMDGQQIIDVGKNKDIEIKAPGADNEHNTWELF